jgi:hypothetical protein
MLSAFVLLTVSKAVVCFLYLACFTPHIVLGCLPCVLLCILRCMCVSCCFIACFAVVLLRFYVVCHIVILLAILACLLSKRFGVVSTTGFAFSMLA